MKTLTQTERTQAKITPEKAIELLKNGNKRFLENKLLHRDYHQQLDVTADAQYPFAAVLSCIDSRIPVEVVFDQGIGDMFSVRIAGNILNDDILGSLEFACKLSGTKAIVVMGHTSCGAVKGACDDAKLGNLTQMLDKIKPAIEQTATEDGEARNSGNIEFVNNVASKNVELTIENIKSQSTVLKEMADNGEIAIVGAMYDVKTGLITF
ncbi:hypothetical protein J1N10_02945 [Carboxylicivirga sp. A043]|uniref:carbonic anhydrase family protein n=1 Tax=Carboxylicivirga litoralis TaxID=2816963 RepID=UPI0021CB6335|nr:carbonic anhydrase family protein [Carboxylicivirga sp. A043]MCU4154916.1 hypothetical protein [Carboxylicivirga sp. A043]